MKNYTTRGKSSQPMETAGNQPQRIPVPYEIGLVMGLTWKVSSVNQGGGNLCL